MWDTSHEGADVAAPVVDAGVEKREEGQLEELAAAQRHQASVLVRDAELEVVEHVQVLQERARVGDDLVHAMTLEAVEALLIR